MYFHILHLVLLLANPLSASESFHDNAEDCDCYSVQSGPVQDNAPLFFSNHRFYDFRYLASSPDDFTNGPPPEITASQDAGTEPTTQQDVLNSTSFSNDWDMMRWGKKSSADAPVRVQNSPQNIFLTQVDPADIDPTLSPPPQTYLTLRTTRLPSFQSTAELENQQKNLLYGSVRFRARVTGAAGAVAGLFFYVDDTNESDVEVLTRDAPTTIRYTNQPAVDPKTGDDAPDASVTRQGMPDWREWTTHRIDWDKHVVRWYADGELVATNDYSVPRRPCGIVLNAWSDGGVWSGNMSVGGGARVDVMWVQAVFNTSGDRGGPGQGRGGKMKREAGSGEETHWFGKRKQKRCANVCTIDGVDKEGFPEVTFRGAATKMCITTGWMWATVAILSVALGAL